MKTKIFFIVFTFASLFYSCNSDDGGNNNIPSQGKGEIIYNGTTYKTDCYKGENLDCEGQIHISMDFDNNNDIHTFLLIDNIPQENSGTFNVVNYSSSINNCDLTANFYYYSNDISTVTPFISSGTITKTGAKSFTYTLSYEGFTPASSYTISGSGNWQ